MTWRLIKGALVLLVAAVALFFLSGCAFQGDYPQKIDSLHSKEIRKCSE